MSIEVIFNGRVNIEITSCAQINNSLTTFVKMNIIECKINFKLTLISYY